MEITVAKKSLIDQFAAMLTDCPLTVAQRHSVARAAHDAEAEDIIKLMEMLDNLDALNKTRFAAIAKDRLPNYGPEEINIYAVVDIQQIMESKIEDATRQLTQIADNNCVMDAVEYIDDRVKMMTAKLEDQLIKLPRLVPEYPICSNLTFQLLQPASIDRSRNIVITGIEENRNSTVWPETVSHVIATAAGREVPLDDAFRLGRFVDGRKRPILVKLQSVCLFVCLFAVLRHTSASRAISAKTSLNIE